VSFTSLRPRTPVDKTPTPMVIRIRYFARAGIPVRLKTPTPRPSRKPVRSLKLFLLCLRFRLCVVQSMMDGRARTRETERPRWKGIE